ncbi:MAG: outer membrane protein assembly factor BamA [Spirochaetales bacterium]|nr:outer membrane protein assembly factor BamA [Spirochaetales bacterium]
MLKRTINVLYIFILLAVFPVFIHAQQSDEEWYLGKPIIDIRFTGLETVSSTELSGLVREYISMDFTDSLFYEIQSKLYALDYFELIIPSANKGDDAGNTVILEFDVKERPVISEIEFVGNDRIRRGELLDTILLKKGDMVNQTSIKLDESAVLDLYLEKGFLDAVVKGEDIKDPESNTSTLVFSIEEGTQTKINEIVFVGNDKYVSDNTLKGQMTTKPQSIFNKGVFQENKLEEDKRAIEQYYHDRGYIDAEVYNVEKSIITDEEKNINFLKITLYIKEGEQFTYGGMEFDGNKIYTNEELMDQVLQQEGKVYNESKFLADFQRISDLYYENGYIFNSITREEKRDEQNRSISHVVTIVERDRAHIENIIIQGNEKTKDHVIYREIPLEVGDVFNKTKIMQALNNLYNTQYFSVVEPQTFEGSAQGLMDLVINVEEGKTSDIIFGIAISGGDGFPISGQVSWSDRNFLGYGQTLGVETKFSPDSQDVSLKFTEPRLFGLRWSGGVNLTYSHISEDKIKMDNDGDGIADNAPGTDAGDSIHEDYLMSYQSHNISAGVSTGYTWVTPVGRFNLSTGIQAGLKLIKYDADVYRPYDELVRNNYGTWLPTDRWWSKAAWDMRDIIYDPSKGFILSETFTLAGTLPTAASEYYKSVTRFDAYFTLFDLPVSETFNFKSVLKFHTALSYLGQRPGGSALNIQEDGFYADGMFLARGWSPVSGGQVLWDSNIELRFPIVKSILSFDVFLDAVGLWGTQDEFGDFFQQGNWGDIKFSLGAGLRLANPQFPFSLYLVKKFKYDESTGGIDWKPEASLDTFGDSGLDLVISFGIDIYQ